MSHLVYVFDCPYHGEERGVFCFRAFERENSNRWKKLQVESKELPLSEKELDAVIGSFLEWHPSDA